MLSSGRGGQRSRSLRRSRISAHCDRALSSDRDARSRKRLVIMQPWMMLCYGELADQRPPGETENVHSTESLAAAVIADFSAEGEAVLDPFAGFGTTPAVASRMGRRAVAVERMAERASYIRQRRLHPRPGRRTEGHRGLRRLLAPGRVSRHPAPYPRHAESRCPVAVGGYLRRWSAQLRVRLAAGRDRVSVRLRRAGIVAASSEWVPAQNPSAGAAEPTDALWPDHRDVPTALRRRLDIWLILPLVCFVVVGLYTLLTRLSQCSSGTRYRPFGMGTRTDNRRPPRIRARGSSASAESAIRRSRFLRVRHGQ